ncbi:MAG TPA: hypothetical protein VIU61_26595 [Kofleriaceae bacterium]
MRARPWGALVVGLVVGLGTVAVADPKPTPVDIKPYRDQLLVFKDSAGYTYVIKPGSDPVVFYGNGKELYSQIVVGRSADGDAWSISTFAPRVAETRPGEIRRKKDGSLSKNCDGKDDYGLTQVTGDKAKAVLDKSAFLSPVLIRRAHFLARDDRGVYYYVDKLSRDHGGKGFRVFVGKKGAMKQLPLTDVASDSAGDIFSTKSGDLRLVADHGSEKTPPALWIKGEKRTELLRLDLDINSPLIFRGLGIYKFLGTLCDNL